MAALWSYARIPFYAVSSLVTFGSGALYVYQNELIYPRNIPPGARTEVPRPTQFGITDFEEVQIPTPDGETLGCFLVKAPNKQYARNMTIMSFHGNAGNAGHRLPIAKVLAHDLHCNVLMVEYRGYGLSTGDPSEKGLTIDAQAALDYVRGRSDLKGTKIVVYGQSLGGAVSIGLVGQNQDQNDIAGLILENTFLSIKKMIPSVMPYARFLTPLCHEVWPSEERMPTVKNVPILFLSGLRDEIVPPSHMKRLFDICQAKVKVWKELPHGDHNNTVAEKPYFYFIDDFIRSHISIDASHFV